MEEKPAFTLLMIDHRSYIVIAEVMCLNPVRLKFSFFHFSQALVSLVCTHFYLYSLAFIFIHLPLIVFT